MPSPKVIEPRRSATLVLVRDAGTGPEVLVTVRPHSLAFMGGATVFPGGGFSAADLDPRWRAASKLSPEDAAARLAEFELSSRRPLPRFDAPLAAYVCALREAFEEVGLVLGEGPIEELRRAQPRDPTGFLEACLSLGVTLGTDRLTIIGRWVTPLGSPIRFDTLFFLAEAPSGWDPSPRVEEVDSCRWVTPKTALGELGEGRALMAPPTIDTLQRLAPHGSVADIVEATKRPEPASGPLSARLSPEIHVVLAPNAGLMTGPGTNTYVVGRGPSLVIDPADDDPDYLEAVTAAAGEVESILVTHRHPDHVGGVRELSLRKGAPVRAFGDTPIGGVPVRPAADREVISAGDVSVRAIHTPGHAPDHLCFLFREPRLTEPSLFSGDLILGEGTPVIAPPDGNMRSYLETLARLQQESIGWIYPGHFKPLDEGGEVVAAYLSHRAARGQAIRNALGVAPIAPDDIVTAVYEDTPPALHPVARQSVLAHLELLEEQGLARRAGESWVAVKGGGPDGGG